MFFCVCFISTGLEYRTESNNGCCSGTIWNETLGKCTGCMPGYFDQYCNKTCEYPRYGMRCMGKCDCEQDICNIVTGCPKYESSTILELSTFIIKEDKSTNPLLNNSTQKKNASLTVYSIHKKSILVPVTLVLGSVLIGVCILYAIIYLLEKGKIKGPTESLSTPFKEDGLYEQIDEIAIHI
ncbi:uncharacterized protein LOC125677461 isoform X2 [Ostrea edulis]|uniref:uncharacterized protein LOC125677461 isoform X2 n=1 Tax=Ostrea edulis TaxID=37623 RepID=UPI0024AEECE0|nr:uncharacterized protein LOC125677461 isoform X2 [Ostrea edulis]